MQFAHGNSQLILSLKLARTFSFLSLICMCEALSGGLERLVLTKDIIIKMLSKNKKYFLWVYRDSSKRPLGFIGGWMCTNGPLIIMAFGPWPSSFFVSSRDHGPRHFILQNWSKTCKNEVPPKYMCKHENDQ